MNSTRIRVSGYIVALVVLCVAIGTFTASAASAPTSCDPGKHMSTAEDVAKGLPANTCVDDSVSNYLNGGCRSNPYDLLQSGGYIGNGQVRPVSSGSGSTDAALRQGIDPALACRLFQFFEATKAKGCTVKIISAYRSAQQQENMCGSGRTGCAAAGKSCHQYGLAVDVQTSCIGWMRAAAPQFQLVFPYYGQHIQCAEHPVASCSPNTKPCNGGVKITPDLSRIPSPSQVPDTYFQPPSTPPQNPFQNPNTPYMSNTPIPPPAYNPQSVVPPNTTYQEEHEEIPTIPVPNTTVTTTPAYIPRPATTTTKRQERNDADSIGAIANDSRSDETGTSVSTGSSLNSSSSTKLNDDLYDLDDSFSASTGGTNDSIATGDRLAVNSVAVEPIRVAQTFTSGDVAQAPSGLSTVQGQSLVVAMLTTLRNLLVTYVNFLKTHSTYGFQGAWQFQR